RTCSRACSTGRNIISELPSATASHMRAVVVSLGDLGRSARMLYHARALAANGVDVDLVGFEGTPLPKNVTEERRITVRRLDPATLRLRRRSSSAGYAAAGLYD